LNKPKIILASGKAEHGKTTFTKILMDTFDQLNIKYVKIAYADYVKFVAQKYYKWNGIKDEVGRKILQWVGTDYVRSIDPNFWVDTVIRFVNVFGSEYKYILIDDCRFPNEIEKWYELDYDLLPVRIFRPNYISSLTTEQLQHPSETSLDDFKFKYYIIAEDYFELQQETHKFIKEVLNESASPSN
jgi:hypothetical protein